MMSQSIDAVSCLEGLEKFTPEYVSELLESPNSHGHTPLHVTINSGHVATTACLLREGVRLTMDTDQSMGRKALHSLASSDVGATHMRALADLLLAHPSTHKLLDARARGFFISAHSASRVKLLRRFYPFRTVFNCLHDRLLKFVARRKHTEMRAFINRVHKPLPEPLISRFRKK